MAIDIIDSSYTSLDTTNLIPSFLSWIMGGALGLDSSLFGIGFLLIIFMVSFLIFKNQGIETGGVASSFITVICSLLFLKAGWTNGRVLFICFVLFAFALYYLFSKKSQVEA